jgi:hypothetical protein
MNFQYFNNRRLINKRTRTKPFIKLFVGIIIETIKSCKKSSHSSLIDLFLLFLDLVVTTVFQFRMFDDGQGNGENNY